MSAQVQGFEGAGNASLEWFKIGFLIAAIYDIVLGAVFFFLYDPIFDWLDMDQPVHASHAHLAAAFVFVQGLGYLFVFRNMLGNLDIVRLGVVYKAIYVGLAVYYFAIGDLPDNVFAWFAVFDMAFVVMFVWFLAQIRSLGLEPERVA